MADLGKVLSEATAYGDDREAEGRAEEKATGDAALAELQAAFRRMLDAARVTPV